MYYMEGYLAASATGLQAALQGRQMAQDVGVALASTLSDISMIKFCRPGLDAIFDNGLDYSPRRKKRSFGVGRKTCSRHASN